MKISFLPLAVAILLILGACGGVESEVPAGTFVAPVVEWQIVFEDDFDGAALDAARWNVDTGDGCPDNCGWSNNELQIYDANNITVAGGILSIEGREELGGGYTSGRLNTNGKFDFQYGRVEVSARVPAGQGIWPAIWLLHSDPSIYGPWPLSGEIDVMEAFNYGVNDARTQSTTHYGLPKPPFNGTSSSTDLSVNADLNFHEYAVEWEKDKIRFFVDGVHYQTQNSDNWFSYYPADENGLYDPLGPYTLGLEDAPFDQAFHLLINFAIGGDAVGDPNVATVFPQTLDIDYVRVYECANANPGTGRGCGTADASVVPLEDGDGGPLQNLVTEQPYIEILDLYLDGPETITVTIGQDSSSNTLQVDGFTGAGATVTNDPAFPDPDDAANTVWHVSVANDVANVFLATEDLSADPILDSGFDFSGGGLGGDPIGEIVFDMQVNSVTPGTSILVKLDSGFPNLGEVVLPESELVIGDWKTYSVKFDDLLANPGFVVCCGGMGVDLKNVANPFVFEVQNGAADVYLDNIRITNACYVVGSCNASPRTRGIPDFILFDDAVNLATWDIGIAGSDSGTGFTDYTDGTNPANKANWAIIADTDPARGQVIDVTFNDSGEFGVWFIQSSGAVDMNAYSAGAVVFDIIVDDYGNNTNGMTMKVDCFFPCTSGDKNLGVIADGVWETVTVPVSTLTATSLDLDAVNSGVVIFPTSQSGTIRFRLDNIRWVADTNALPKDQIDLPVTFDDPLVDYSLIDFGGTSTTIVDDPAGGSNQIAQTTHNGGAFAGTVIGLDAGFANPIPFTATETTMSLRVRSPAAGIPVMLKVEDSSDPNVFAEVIATTTVANGWETLVYDYVGAIDPVNVSYEKAVLFFNFPNAGDGSVYFWDDVAFGAAGPVLNQVDLPVTFDDSNVNYDLVDFGNVGTTLVADPINVSNTVASTNKPPGAELWGGTTVGGTNGLASAIPLTASNTTMAVRVYSPDAGIPVRLKVEDKTDPTISVETEATTTVVNTWETLTFDFANEAAGTAPLNPASTYDKASIFFNFGTDGNTAGDKTYLWDDLEFGAGGGGQQQVSLPISFDDPGVDYDLIAFGNASAMASVTDPDPADPTNLVASLNKPPGAELWSGVTMGATNGLAAAIPFTAAETRMSVNVYSPDAGIPVRMKVENAANASVSVETEVLTTKANEWETLVFDFSNEVGGTPTLDLGQSYEKAVLFFNFGTDGNTAGDKTYYWDDVQFGAALMLPLTFDDSGVNYDLVAFGNASAMVPVADPLNATNSVASFNKPPGAELWAGVTMGATDGLSTAIPFAAGETLLSVRVYSPDAGIPVRMKVEKATNAAISVETEVLTTMANTWETLVFDFSNEVGGTPPLDLAQNYEKVVLFFNFGTDGNTAGDKTYLWDDVTFGATP